MIWRLLAACTLVVVLAAGGWPVFDNSLGFVSAIAADATGGQLQEQIDALKKTAADARARAAAATNDVSRKLWNQSAAEADQQAAQLVQRIGNPEGPVPQSQSTPNTAPSSTAAATQDKSTPASTCEVGIPLDPAAIVGRWTDQNRGGDVAIEGTNPNSPTGLTLKGKHEWQGGLVDGKLIFKRKPLTAEMSHTAPDWARAAVQGKLEWRLELYPRFVNGDRQLCGQWFPGLIKIREDLDANGKVTAHQASVEGPGPPIDILYRSLPPAIMGVVVLDDQTAMSGGVPAHPYPFPEPPQKLQVNFQPDEPLEFDPYFIQEQHYGASGHARAANGRLYVPNERRTLFVFGNGLPRDWKTPITVAGGIGANGLHYKAVALDSERPELLGEKFARQLKDGRGAALRVAGTDADTIALIAHANGMLITVDFDSGVLPGLKDFTVNGVSGNSGWVLRFGDTRAQIGFGRLTAPHEGEWANDLFLPERVFIQVKTEVALPLDEIALRVRVNKADVHWNGAETIIAKRIPDDSSKTLYRTATIELTEPGKPHGPADRGVMFLPTKVSDHLYLRLDDPFLLDGEADAATVHNQPGDVGMTWKTALTRAAVADGVKVTAWNRLSGQKAAEIANYVLTEPIRANPNTEGWGTWLWNRALNATGYTGPDYTIRHTVPVTVGEHAALLMFRDEFLRRMKLVSADPNVLPTSSDPMVLLALRHRLQPDAWEVKSAWNHLTITCPDGSQCPFSFVLSDDFIKRSFGDSQNKAEHWTRDAMHQALVSYKAATDAATKKMADLKDDDVEGLIALLGQDCIADLGDQPCGYKALRPFLLPRMMRSDTTDNSDDTKPHLWISDLNARYELRNLHSLIAAVKAQKNYSSVDTAVSIAVASILTGPLAHVSAAVKAVGAVMSTPGFGTITAIVTEVPDGLRARDEVQFAQGASLILGQERLSLAESSLLQWGNAFAGTLGLAFGQDILSLYQTAANSRTAALLKEIEGIKASAVAVKALPRADQRALARSVTEAMALETSGNVKAMSTFEKRVATVAVDVLGDLHFGSPTPREAPSTLIDATGDAAPVFAEEKPPNAQAEGPPPDPAAEVEGPVEPKAAEKTPPYSPGERPPIPQKELDRLASQVPASGKVWEALYEGQVHKFQLGRQLGLGPDGKPASAYARVFILENSTLPQCRAGCVIKIYDMPDALESIVSGSERLRSHGSSDPIEVLQPKNYYVSGPKDGPSLYIIQEQLKEGPDLVMFKLDDAASEAAFAENPAFGESFVETMSKVTQKNLDWADPKFDNQYMKRIGGKWECGILDTDLITPHADRTRMVKRSDGTKLEIGTREGAIVSYIEAYEGFKYIGSLDRARVDSIATIHNEWAQQKFHTNFNELPPATQAMFTGNVDNQVNFFYRNPGPYYPSAEFFAEKMFERLGWVGFDRRTRLPYKRRIDPETIKKWYPKFGTRDRAAPIDVTVPPWQAPGAP